MAWLPDSPFSRVSHDFSVMVRSSMRGPFTLILQDSLEATPRPDFLPVSSTELLVCIPTRRIASERGSLSRGSCTQVSIVFVLHFSHSVSLPYLTGSWEQAPSLLATRCVNKI